MTDDDDFDEDLDLCQTCGGEGIETGDDLMEDDPLWWDGTDYIRCRNCGGSGRAKDQTYW